MRRRTILTAVVVAIGLLAASWFLFFDRESPDRLTLDRRAAQAPGAELAGRWIVAEGSVAGYRVREKLARLPARSDAVGRSTAVTGGFTLEPDGDRVVARDARFEVDLRQLRSDESRRDDRLRTSGLQTDRFPTATWESSFTIPVPAGAGSSGPVQVLTRGELTIHGITRTIAIPVDAQVVDGHIEVAGSLRFLMGDFKISPPNVAGIVTVDPCATMEFKLRFAREATARPPLPAGAVLPVQLIRFASPSSGCVTEG